MAIQNMLQQINCAIFLALVAAYTVKAGSDEASASEDSSGGGAGGGDPHDVYIYAHAWLMAIAFAILFPLGAILIRTTQITLHAAWQIWALTVTIAGFGLGAYVAQGKDEWTKENGHAVIGTVIFALMLLLPLGGYYGHRVYRRIGPNSQGKAHKWLARVLVTIGFINGGLGFDLSQEKRLKYIYAYSIVGGVLILTWWVTAFMNHRKVKNTVRTEKANSTSSAEQGMI